MHKTELMSGVETYTIRRQEEELLARTHTKLVPCGFMNITECTRNENTRKGIRCVEDKVREEPLKFYFQCDENK